MPESTVSQRIATMLDHFSKGNKSAFAKAVGISNQSLGEIVGGRQNAPSFAALQKIALAYPSISLSWLVLGEGSMFELTDEDRAHKLELFASEVEDEAEKSGVVDDFSYMDESILFALREDEEIERAELHDAHEAELAVRRINYQKTNAGEQLTAHDKEELAKAELQRKAAERAYVYLVRKRMRAERMLLRFETDSTTAVYRLGDEPDRSRLYGGLLSNRLNISGEAAERLVKSGKIRAAYIDGEGYRITEQAVRTFLGEF
jgi:excisionase family DNA binding protein